MKWINSVKPALAASTAVLAMLATMPAFADYTTTLSANPASYNGTCPTIIKFNGSITAEKAGRVQYKFIRSDNAFAPIQTIEFTAPGTKQVDTTWTLGGPALPHYSGWQAVQIVYPTNIQSKKATFSIRCAAAPTPEAAPTPKPKITGYQMPGPQGACVPKGSRFTILGRHFGSQAGKGIALGGHGIHVDLPMVSWSDSQIVATLPDDPRIQERQWYYTGVEKDSHNQWLSNISKNITVCPSRKPDLVIRQFELKGGFSLEGLLPPHRAVEGEGVPRTLRGRLSQWGTCAPNNAVMAFQVTVANIGTAPSPAVADTALVEVMDGHRNWGNGAKLGAIPPGGSQTVEIPVYYLQDDPQHMISGAPHPFRAVADPGNRVTESNEGNNQSAVINAGAPMSCK
jgi:hypothetical protein